MDRDREMFLPKSIFAMRRVVSLFLALVAVGAMRATDYNLAPSIQEGVILHCFCWKFTQITEELENIAAAGFTAVQTSPAQLGRDDDRWYYFYQPLGFYIGSGRLGTPEELEELCTKAHELGIFVIVDVVGNHLGTGDGDEADPTYHYNLNIQEDLKDYEYWHDYIGLTDSDRYSVTHHCLLGLPDLATENDYVQQCELGYLKELASVGVDGVRWDAATHIDLPSEFGSEFWPTMTTESGITTLLGNEMWHYGEILAPQTSTDMDLMEEYIQYMSFTDSQYGESVRSQIDGGSISMGSNIWGSNVGYDKVLYWAESHDTYSNGEGASQPSQNIMDRAWALIASRYGATALYFSRPFETEKDSILAGVKGSTHFTSAEVAEVNRLHNLCVGEPEAWVVQDSLAAVCRQRGAVIALVGTDCDKEVTVTNGDGLTNPGTYYDKVSGNEFVVTDSLIVGTVGSTGIAVIYDETLPAILFSPESCAFYGDTLDITITPSNATTATVQIGDDGSPVEITSRTVFTIGEGYDYGDTITIYYSATNEYKSISGSTTYRKRDPDVPITIYCLADEAPYLYAWANDGHAINSAWPGTLMADSITINGVEYYYTKFYQVEEINIIFNAGNYNQTADITGITEDSYFYYNGSTGYDTLTTPVISYYLIGDVNDWTTGVIEGATDMGVTIYVTSDSGDYYAWIWGDNTNYTNYTGGTWPGTLFSDLPTAQVNGEEYYYVQTTSSSVYAIFNEGYGNAQTADLGPFTEATFFSYNGGTSAEQLDVEVDESNVYLFEADDESLVVEVPSSSLESTGLAFQIYATDETVYGYDGVVEYNTEYTFVPTTATASLASIPTDDTAVFVITEIGNDQLTVEVLDGESGAVTAIDMDDKEVTIVATSGLITVLGCDDVAVYNLSGTLVGRGAVTKAVPGIYIVRVGYQVRKVALR